MSPPENVALIARDLLGIHQEGLMFMMNFSLA